MKGREIKISEHITKIKKEKLCNFCGTPIGKSEKFCSKKCKEIDEISDSIQKISYCAELIKVELGPNHDRKISEMINLLEKYSYKISEKIVSLRDLSSK